MEYMNKRGGQIILSSVPEPKASYVSAKEALIEALNMEKEVNEVILTNMSVAPGVLCSICMECFNKDDCVDSTSCGHIYHSTCIQNCLTRSKQCPKCHAKCRGTYKLVLDFDDSGDKASKQLEENFLVLQKDYPEVEINKQLKEEHRYLSLQVNARNKEISLLQEKIKRMEAQTPKQKRTRKRNSRTSF
ncbi:uncharacterized protein ACN2A1_012434 [Glossina fuscipes fuscipes]